MAPRRSHKKSRAGCLRCKKRRIKCDEVHPSCGNCVKHAIECDFSLSTEERAALAPSARASNSAPPPPTPPSPTPAISTANSPNVSLESLPSPSPSQPHPSPGPIHSPDLRPAVSPITPASNISINATTDPLLLAEDAKQQVAGALPPPSPALSSSSFGSSSQLILFPFLNTPAPEENLNMLDLSLMHRWVISTADTLSSNKAIQDLWRVNIPALAMQHPFLMHSLLAISALHLQSAESDHEKSIHYLTEAARHQEQALRGMAACLTHISRDNCDALVVSSSIVAIYTFVSSRIDEITARPKTIPTTTFPSWVPFLRGINSILKQVWTWVTSGPLSPLLRQHELSSNKEGLDAETEAVLANLYRLCTDRSLPGSEELSDTTISTAYFSAIAELRMSFATISHWKHIIGSIFVWPITASDKFVELLVEGRPRALVIFMHYCALFTLIEGFWWAKGSALHELKRCEMCLGEEWKTPWVEWPKARILGRDIGRVVRGVNVRGETDRVQE